MFVYELSGRGFESRCSHLSTSMLECVVIASLKTNISLSIRFFISLIACTLNVSNSSLKGKLFPSVSEFNKGQGFKCSWIELSSWVEWMER